MAMPRKLWRCAPKTMALRPADYDNIVRYPACMLLLGRLKVFKGVVLKGKQQQAAFVDLLSLVAFF